MIINETNIQEFLSEDGKILRCGGLEVTSLTIPETCTCLEEIICSLNFITTLIIPRKCVELKKIHCHVNKLTSLEIPDTCTKLENIHCYYNQISTMIIPSTCTNLKYLACDVVDSILIFNNIKFEIDVLINDDEWDQYKYYREKSEKYLCNVDAVLSNFRLFSHSFQ